MCTQSSDFVTNWTQLSPILFILNLYCMFIYCMFTNTGSMQSARLTESILYVHLLYSISMANWILSVLYSYSQYMAHLHQKKQHPFLCNTPFLLQSLHKPIAAKNQLTCLLQQTDITCKFRRQMIRLQRIYNLWSIHAIILSI